MVKENLSTDFLVIETEIRWSALFQKTLYFLISKMHSLFEIKSISPMGNIAMECLQFRRELIKCSS